MGFFLYFRRIGRTSSRKVVVREISSIRFATRRDRRDHPSFRCSFTQLGIGGISIPISVGVSVFLPCSVCIQ